MKQIVLVITIILSSLCLFAQRVNERGLKCVSEIECVSSGLVHKYVFEYFDNLKLKSMTIYTDNKIRHRFKIENDVLTRKSYDYIDSYSTWTYDMDVYGNITRITREDKNTDGSRLKIEHTYTYAQSDRHPWRNVIEDNEIEWVKLPQSRIYKRNNNNWVRRFDYPNGIICESTFSYKYEDAADRFNFNVKNDTNIDFWQFWIPRTTNETIVALTEWLCLRPDYLMNDIGSHFEYEYDSYGNLIRIIERSWNYKYLYKEIKIKYLY